MNLPKRLTELREKRGLTQAQLAEQMDVTRQTVSRWELGEVAPSAENLKKLGELYGLSVDDLLSDDPIVPESREDRQAPVPARSRRGLIALLLIIAILTMAMVIGHFSRKGGGTEEEIPVGKLQEEKIVSTPESEFDFTWVE